MISLTGVAADGALSVINAITPRQVAPDESETASFKARADMRKLKLRVTGSN
jgi:hypothetical protein